MTTTSPSSTRGRTRRAPDRPRDQEFRAARAGFAALITLDGVKGRHTPTATGTGEVGTEWVFSFADHPQFGWEVVSSVEPGGVDGRTIVELHAFE